MFNSKTADPHLTMQWIKAVETAKSIDDFVTSQSITGRRDFPGNDLLDAMTASALKKLLNTQVHFRKRVSVEEQRAQKYDRFLRARQICNLLLQNDDVQDIDVWWDQAPLSASDKPSDVILEGLCKSKITRLCSASDSLFGFVRSRNRSKQWTDKLFTIEDICKTSY